MSDFTDAMLAGHRTTVATLGASSLTCLRGTFTGHSSTVLNAKTLEESGYLGIADIQFDMELTEFGTSGIADRDRVSIDGSPYEVIGIQKGQHSPTVHLLLKIDR